MLARDAAKADQLSQVLFDVAEALRVAAILLLPVMPGSAAEILRRVGETRSANAIRLADAAWRTAVIAVIAKGDAMWPRSEPERAAAAPADSQKKRSTRVDEQKPSQPAAPAAPPVAAPAPAAPAVADKITIDDFMKVELRTAKVLTAEKVPNSRSS